jgi:hypothetical protein
MKPTIGRIVWYQAHGSPNGQHKSEPRPAIITSVKSDTLLTLAVFNPTGMFFNETSFDEAGGPGTWRWPEIVK